MSFWCFFALLFASAPTSLPFPLDAPEEGGLVATDSKGKQRWQATWSMAPLIQDGRNMIRLSEEGQGVHSPFKQTVRWNFEAWWQVGPPLQPSRVEKRFTDLQGNLLLTRQIEFDWNAGQVRVESRRSDGSAESESLKVPAGTWTPEGLAVALRQKGFRDGKTLQAHLLTDEPKLYKVRFKNVGRETVSTPDGPVECYKLRMEVNLGFLALFKFLIPDTYFWFGADPPHMWVRYQGLESGRGSPQVVRSMTSFARRASQN